jgi:hypothetical protein
LITPSRPPPIFAREVDPILGTVRVSLDATPWAIAVIRTLPEETVMGPERATPFSVTLPEGDYRVELRSDFLGSSHVELIRVRHGEPSDFLIHMPGFEIDAIVTRILGR